MNCFILILGTHFTKFRNRYRTEWKEEDERGTQLKKETHDKLRGHGVEKIGLFTCYGNCERFTYVI